MLACLQLKDMVRKQAAHDVDPPLGETALYIKNEMTKEGYRHLLAAGKLCALGLLSHSPAYRFSIFIGTMSLMILGALLRSRLSLKPLGCV